MTAVALNTIQLVDGSARRTLCPLVSLTIQCSMGRPLSKKKRLAKYKVPKSLRSSAKYIDVIVGRVRRNMQTGAE